MLTPPPVKIWAQAQGIPVYQPKTLTDGFLATLKTSHAELFVVAAYGLIFPISYLSAPRFGCINVHASLLPKYRGPSPVSSAILSGDKTTGTTIMRMEPAFDTGPIIAQKRLKIAPDDTRGSLSEKLAEQGAALLVQALPDYIAGQLPLQMQKTQQVTQTHLLSKRDGRIDWHKSAAHIDLLVRAYTPWPGAWTMWQEQPLKILRVAVLNPDVSCATVDAVGKTFVTADGYLAVQCGKGSIKILEAQRAGKKPMGSKELLQGTAALRHTQFT